jgi:hypothetical protein
MGVLTAMPGYLCALLMMLPAVLTGAAIERQAWIPATCGAALTLCSVGLTIVEYVKAGQQP